MKGSKGTGKMPLSPRGHSSGRQASGHTASTSKGRKSSASPSKSPNVRQTVVQNRKKNKNANSKTSNAGLKGQKNIRLSSTEHKAKQPNCNSPVRGSHVSRAQQIPILHTTISSKTKLVQQDRPTAREEFFLESEHNTIATKQPLNNVFSESDVLNIHKKENDLKKQLEEKVTLEPKEKRDEWAFVKANDKGKRSKTSGSNSAVTGASQSRRKASKDSDIPTTSDSITMMSISSLSDFEQKIKQTLLAWKKPIKQTDSQDGCAGSKSQMASDLPKQSAAKPSDCDDNTDILQTDPSSLIAKLSCSLHSNRNDLAQGSRPVRDLGTIISSSGSQDSVIGIKETHKPHLSPSEVSKFVNSVDLCRSLAIDRNNIEPSKSKLICTATRSQFGSITFDDKIKDKASPEKEACEGSKSEFQRLVELGDSTVNIHVRSSKSREQQIAPILTEPNIRNDNKKVPQNEVLLKLSKVKSKKEQLKPPKKVPAEMKNSSNVIQIKHKASSHSKKLKIENSTEGPLQKKESGGDILITINIRKKTDDSATYEYSPKAERSESSSAFKSKSLKHIPNADIIAESRPSRKAQMTILPKDSNEADDSDNNKTSTENESDVLVRPDG